MTALAYAPPRSPLKPFPDQSSPASKLGLKVLELVLEADSHVRNNATDWRSLTKSLIEEVAIECQSSNWDGYEAQPISEAAKRHAQLFIDLLPYSFPAPDPVPDSDGEIALSWDFGPGHIFTLSISQTGMLSYAGLLGEGVKRHGMEPFKGDIPQSILESITELCERANVIR
jgi:hypothetical protein